MGIKTLNALTFKLSVTQILTQVATDDFFFKFDDEIIPNLLHDTFVDNDSIHESKCDTEEDVSAKVEDFLESGTESEKQEKALEISKMIAKTTEVSETERTEILAKLEALGKRLKEGQLKDPSGEDLAPWTEQLHVATDDVEEITGTVSAPTSPVGAKEDFAAAATLDFRVNKAKSMTDLVSWDLGSPARLGYSEDSEEEEFADSISLSGLPTLDDSVILSDADNTLPDASMTDKTPDKAVPPFKMRKKPFRKGRRPWSVPRRRAKQPAIKFATTKPEPKHNWAKTLRKGVRRPQSARVTKKKTLSRLIKSKMIGIKFVAHVSEQAELQKLQEKKRQQDAKNLTAWFDKKRNKGKKKRPHFDLRSFQAKTGETNVHSLRVGGMRNPYDLEGVQFVPAERLGAWREEESGKAGKTGKAGKKQWSSAFHTAKFPSPSNRGQPYKLKNRQTARRAIQPKLITFGEYGEVEWFTCLKSQDAHYQVHAENMTRLQLARKLLGEQKKNS